MQPTYEAQKVELPKPGFFEKLAIGVAKTVITHVIAAFLETWGPHDLAIAISVDVNLVENALQAVPDQMRWGKALAAGFPKVDDALAENVVYEFIRKNYPHLFVYDVGGQRIEILASPQGKEGLFRNVKRLRDYFWGP